MANKKVTVRVTPSWSRAVQNAKQRGRARKSVPWLKLERMHRAGKTNMQMAIAINRVDVGKPDPTHTLRGLLNKMHKGYRNAEGKLVRLPYKISRSTLRKCTEAGIQSQAA
jgi:hypothetical protein